MHREWQRWIARFFAVLLAAQAFVLAVLAAVAERRKRRAPPAHFPHLSHLDQTLEGMTLALYTYGSDLYTAMLDAIDGAQQCIYLETFIWQDDPLGETFKQHLLTKAAAGVHVYVIFDGLINMFDSRRFKHFPTPIHALEYRTMTKVWYAFDLRRYARDHRKLLVVDHATAFIGGFNIGQLYATEWRDTHLRLQGSPACELAAAFVDFWNTHAGQPPIAAAPIGSWPGLITVQRNDPARLIFPIRGMYLDAIARAQHHIYLTNAYFIPDRVVLDALLQAALRGVDVRVLLPWQSNHISADWLARGFFDTCLRHGVRLFGYQDAMIHAKTATIDGIWSTVGTANLDRLSLIGNYEINVSIRDASFAAELERIFALDLTNAKEITLETWIQRPWYVRAGELILSPLRPLL